MSLFLAAPPALLAQRLVRALTRARRPMTLAALRAAVGLAPRARRLRPVLEALEDAGVVEIPRAQSGPVTYRLARAPHPGELDPPRREFYLLAEAVVGPTLEVRAIRYVDSPSVWLQVRRVRRFPSGALTARPVLGLSVADAQALGKALLEINERFEREAVNG